ncbi:putative SOS response-associated peptidase YedK [Paenibacillus cellulosilyticus]|uniref:Abasic site processing protein n=1 Tax=Paenibacillus cellulosilyticus TaxID=375489 RepID=A0A2V2Z5X8_9BACL|nr:SOS response-associated peptidase [Paenibacillus cellulosilyticus]PWW06250.1 putative SOS response-associated peptidase YedK [Paenibacillus cellulosilyticus]QKS42997.1 SOS response-associated peptidase [Paenibacillus cellulosilyticus]
MCGRYTLTVSLEEMMLRFMIGHTNVPYHRPQYNVAPGQLVLAIINDGEQNRLGELKWGLVPPWADDPKIGSKMLNARAESAADKPAFREAVRRKRCLIPADSFYEWKTRQDGTKQPMRIVMRDRQPFAMAGLYETWVAADGSKLSTCTVLTTSPNELMEPIHNRMPVLLRPEDEPLWLDRKVSDPARLQHLFQPFDESLMDAYPVSASVGSVRNDFAELIEPIET